MKQQKMVNVVLPLALVGAVILSGIGFLGLIISSIDVDDDIIDKIPMERQQNAELEAVESEAEFRFDESFDQAEQVKHNIPSERDVPINKGYDAPEVQEIDAQGDSTRSSDDLLEDTGFITIKESPDAPQVEMDETLELLNGQGHLLGSTQEWIEGEEAPSELPIPEVETETELPVDEMGMNVDTDKVSDIADDIEDVDSEITDYLGDNTPETTSAGISKEDLQDLTWSVSNKTTRDSDKDGNPEFISELNVATGTRNDTILNGVLSWVAGFGYTYNDDDSDGTPNREELVIVRYANYTINGKIVAEGIAFSSFMKNDTDSDGRIDVREFKHLSFGSRATILGTIRSFASAGELIEKDNDGDGVFEDREATAVFYFKHETVNPAVTLKESFIMVTGKEDTSTKELSKLAFTRVNSTTGKTLLEVGYIWSYREEGSMKNLLVIGARNNTVTNRVQYAIFNGTETISGASTTYHVTAFAVDNRSLLFGGVRSDTLALDYEITLNGTERYEKGFLAAARNDDRPIVDTETFLLISLERTFSGTVLNYENVTIIAGRNVTVRSSLNSTMGYVFREYRDADLDGNPEFLKEAVAISITRDNDTDGIKEWEAYSAFIHEIWDNNSDGDHELVQNFTMMGWKSDPNDDGNIDVERGLMRDIKDHDVNSNGTVELREEGIVGFVKNDNDSDGVIDHEKYMGFWKKITDTYDDGTEVTEESGTWTNESP
ncbi:MAG: hypothetical protein U9R75_05075 [Candidatus Thermoplasmatota archaeon]|nr:hypothetical protein [Candidatus Thermoplasmatota archaeon]